MSGVKERNLLLQVLLVFAGLSLSTDEVSHILNKSTCSGSSWFIFYSHFFLHWLLRHVWRKEQPYDCEKSHENDCGWTVSSELFFGGGDVFFHMHLHICKGHTLHMSVLLPAENKLSQYSSRYYCHTDQCIFRPCFKQFIFLLSVLSNKV